MLDVAAQDLQAHLLQVLWCPTDHDLGQEARPTVHLVWRRHEPARPIAGPPPRGIVNDDYYLPTQCVLAPERFTEFPDELPENLTTELENADTDIALHPIPVGSKVGGWPRWVYHHGVPTVCHNCGREMHLLLTVDSCEDGGLSPIRVNVGRSSNLHIYVCTTCPDHPVRLFM